jgi:predicted nucleotidyltransferase
LYRQVLQKGARHLRIGGRILRASWKVDEERKAVLLNELQRIISLCPGLNINKLMVCGSVARGEVTRGSDLDLVIIQETDLPFMERLEKFYTKIQPEVAVDVLIYTPGEIKELATKRSFIRQLLEEGRVVYEKKTG